MIAYYEPVITSASEYYPFGMMMRQASAKNYRFGFNGKENDNEVKGLGNHQDYGMRIYDGRLGRFLSVDPITKEYPWYTPYQFAGNKPIYALDLDGAEEMPYMTQFEYDGSWGIFDRLKAVPNAAGRGWNAAVVDTWNSGVVHARSLKRGTWTQDVKKDAKATVAGVKNYVVEGYNYHVNTPIKQQFTDAWNYFSSPQALEDALFIGGNLYLGGKLSSGKGNLIRPVQSPPSIALGLDEPVAAGPPRSLARFADQNLALYHKQWQSAYGSIADGKSFGQIFTRVMDYVVESKGTIKFDLTKVDFHRVARDKGLSAEASSSYTNWELNQVIGNNKYLKNTIFYENGTVKPTKDVLRTYEEAVKAVKQ